VKIACDGRRLDAHEASALFAAAGENVLVNMMAAQGFQLKPMRAPRRLHHGNLVLRLVWEKRDGNVRVVVRSTITLVAPDVA
jgi:hypothetical protein